MSFGVLDFINFLYLIITLDSQQLIITLNSGQQAFFKGHSTYTKLGLIESNNRFHRHSFLAYMSLKYYGNKHISHFVASFSLLSRIFLSYFMIMKIIQGII